MSFALFRSFHTRRFKDSVDPSLSDPGDTHDSPLRKLLYPAIHKKDHSGDGRKQFLVDVEDDSLQSIDSSSVVTKDNQGLTTYQSHTFQQSLSIREHPDGIQWKKLTSFMLQSRWGDRDTTSQRPLQPACWNFDRDYEESKDDSRYGNIDDDEDEEFVCFDDKPIKAQRMGIRSALFADESKEEDLKEDSALMADHFQLLARHPIFRSTLEDLGSRNVPLCEEFHSKNLETDSIVSGDPLDFQPRYQEPLSDDNFVGVKTSLDDCESQRIESTSFALDAPIRLPEGSPVVEKCFENILLVSPEFFEGSSVDSNMQSATKVPEKMSVARDAPILADMIHPMNLDLFPTTFETPMKSFQDVNRKDQRGDSPRPTPLESPDVTNTVTSTSSSTPPESFLHRPFAKVGPMEKLRKNLASSFRSKANGTKARLKYSLSQGKKGMSEEERIQATDMLPKSVLPELKQRTNVSSLPRKDNVAPGPLSVLLLHPTAKVFETVQVDYIPDTTTVGDILSKARSNATDSLLSEQKYVSLCNKEQELAAPMLSVSLLVSRVSKVSCDNSDYDVQLKNREAHLLVAVPEGYTAAWCQAVRRALWSHPKMQRWWNQIDDPFRPSTSRVPDSSEAGTLIQEKKTEKKARANRRRQEV